MHNDICFPPETQSPHATLMGEGWTTPLPHNRHVPPGILRCE